MLNHKKKVKREFDSKMTGKQRHHCTDASFEALRLDPA
jgi:hypothetical protein